MHYRTGRSGRGHQRNERSDAVPGWEGSAGLARSRVGGVDRTLRLTRAYTAGGRKLRAWHGYHHHKAIDHFTGGVLAVDVHSAAKGEYLAHPRLYERLVATTGADPIAVAMDRGYSLERIHRFHSERGVATVAPYRKRGPMDPPQAAGTDEGGLLRERPRGRNRLLRRT